MTQMSFLIDLGKYKFSDSGPTWIQAFPLGTWQHPVHGEIKITPDRIKRFAENVSKRVRGQDLNIDYDHKGGEAAGWVRAAEDRGNDGLWLSVDWTPTARAQLAEKKYRYFSPEYEDEWENPAQPGVKLQDVLYGGAVTNRPFLKGIVPINLSEAFASALEEPKGDEGGKNGVGSQDDKDKDKTDKTTTAPVALTEEQLLAIPAIKALMESNTALAATVKTLQEKSVADSARMRLSDMNQPVNGKVIAPALIESATLALTDPAKAGDAIVTMLQAMRDGNAVVELGERGSQRTTMVDQGSVKAFMDLVGKIQTERKVDYITAVQVASAENRTLAEAYTNATMQSVEA